MLTSRPTTPLRRATRRGATRRRAAHRSATRRSGLAACLALLAVGATAACSTPPDPTSGDPISITVPTTSSARGLNVAVPERPPGEPSGRHHGPLGADDGRLPSGATVFDEYPGVAHLDPALLRALRDAATEARHDGITITLNSGWRSAGYQEQLLEDAVSEYGSRAEAARWVATPTTSPHVSGDAVDVAGSRASSWLADHGEEFGLCRVFRNEPWHFELRPSAVEDGCPRQYADPTDDPRMHR